MAAKDEFLILYSDKQRMTMPKPELISRLTDLTNEKLLSDSRWELRDKLTTFLFNGFSAFMLVVHEQCAILSKSYQSNSLIIFDIAKNVNKTLRVLEKMKETRGAAEKCFSKVVSEGDVLQGLYIYYTNHT